MDATSKKRFKNKFKMKDYDLFFKEWDEMLDKQNAEYGELNKYIDQKLHEKHGDVFYLDDSMQPLINELSKKHSKELDELIARHKL